MNPYVKCPECSRIIRKNLLSRHKCEGLGDKEIEIILKRIVKNK